MKGSKAAFAGFGLALAAFSFAPVAIAATDISHPTQALQFLDNTTDFGATFGNNQRNNFFADKFTFSISDRPYVILESYLSSISSRATNGLEITDFTIRNNAGVVAQGVQESRGDIDLWSLYNVTLQPGDYWLQVNGFVVSNTGGSFGANVNLTPVPEAETWAMMLGGLSVLGALARRRKQA
ncbi:FxDxF family PEP-CTERM protein [Massilia sp. W12]|uniref:FxDxF family PEP-CTERM protein n=1 Tax=Massilia sp. W12 TaxID=3126507 RepID=UPI0030CA8AA9